MSIGLDASGQGSGDLSQADSSAGQQIRHSVLYLTPVVVGAVLPLVTLPIITRILTKEEYGAWALATVYATVASAAAGLGLPVIFERNFFDCQSRRDRAALLYSTVLFVALSSTAVGIVTWVAARALSFWLTGSSDYGRLLIWSFVGSAAVGIKAYYLTYFRSTANARAYVRYSIDENVAGTLLTVLLVAVLRVGVIGLAIGPSLASLLVLVLVVRRVRQLEQPVFSLAQLRSSLGLALPLTPRVFIKVVAGNFDKYLVGVLASVGGAGVYAIGQRLAYSVFTLMTALENVFTPQVYRKMFTLGVAGGEDIGRYLKPFIYVSVGVALLVTAFSEEAIALLTSTGYRDAVPVASLLAFYYAVLFFGKLPQLVYAKKTSLLLVVSVVSVVLNAGLCGWFASRWGATGAAGGTLLGGLLSNGLYMALGQRYFPIRWPYRQLALMFGLLAFAVLVGFVARDGQIAYWTGLALRVGVVGAYLWLGAALGVVTRDQLVRVQTALRGGWSWRMGPA